MKKDLVDLHYKLAWASLGVGGVPNLDRQINKLLNLLEQGTVTAVDLVKLWSLEEVTLADVLRMAAEMYETVGDGQCKWVPGKMEAAGRVLDKILTTGVRTLGLQLHPEFRNQTSNSTDRKNLRKFVNAFVKWHLISAHSGFRADHKGLFSGVTAPALVLSDRARVVKSSNI